MPVPIQRSLTAASILSVALFTSSALANELGSGLETRSGRPFVHRIDLYAEDGSYIDPTRPGARVFSNDATCGKCHDVDAVSGGWHFNYADREVDRGRPGEPWILVDEATGTQIPISYREWPGTWSPEQLNLSPQDFVGLFGRHLPGGGVGHSRNRAEDGDDRWERTGDLGIDCMVCHSISPNYDPMQRVPPIEAGNYEYVSVVAMGLGMVKGSAFDEQAAASADPFADFDPAREEEAVKASVEFAYNLTRFGGEKRALFEVVREIPAGNCLFCHTTHISQPADDAHDWQRARDVHLQSGMSCVDCHRNDISHDIVRGYEGEMPWAHTSQDAFTCRGCHMGAGSTHSVEVTSTAGGLGSPIPGHHGIPTIHFETMSCTSCHSGPVPRDQQEVVQTSMAHGLGIARLGRRDDEWPQIIQPVFLPDQTGKLAPHKMMWPSFFANLRDDGTVMPILPRDLMERAGPLKTGQPSPNSRDVVINALQALSSSGVSGAVYVANGFLHRLSASGDALVEEEHMAAHPYAWPIAHDVRPAGQSLGARGCQECHSPDAPFLFSRVAVPLALERALPLEVPATGFSGLDDGYHKRFAASFAFRSAFKVVGFVSIAILSIVTLAGIVSVLLLRGGRR